MNEVITYTLRDNSGMLRGRGFSSEAQARNLAMAIIENTPVPVSLTIERVVYTSSTAVETVDVVTSE